jgi:hypothetical protein
MKTKTELITPEMAKKILSSANTNNRKLQQRKVETYARDMRAGAFITTHQGIAFDENEVLLDGQHRLAAIVLCGKPIQMLVTRGLPKSTRVKGTIDMPTWDVIDKGLRRGDGEALARKTGCRNGNKMAAVLRAMLKAVEPTLARDVSLPQIELAMEVVGESVEACVSIGEGKNRSLYRPTAPVLAAFAMAHAVPSSSLAAEALLKEAMSITGGINAPSRALFTWTKNHPQSGGAGSMVHFKVAASVIQAHLEGRSLSKVYASETATEWIKVHAGSVVKKLCAIVAL